MSPNLLVPVSVLGSFTFVVHSSGSRVLRPSNKGFNSVGLVAACRIELTNCFRSVKQYSFRIEKCLKLTYILVYNLYILAQLVSLDSSPLGDSGIYLLVRRIR